jgi:hypothetical protein
MIEIYRGVRIAVRRSAEPAPAPAAPVPKSAPVLGCCTVTGMLSSHLRKLVAESSDENDLACLTFLNGMTSAGFGLLCPIESIDRVELNARRVFSGKSVLSQLRWNNNNKNDVEKRKKMEEAERKSAIQPMIISFDSANRVSASILPWSQLDLQHGRYIVSYNEEYFCVWKEHGSSHSRTHTHTHPDKLFSFCSALQSRLLPLPLL